MSNRLPSSEDSENEVTAVVISIRALGSGLGLGGGALGAGAAELSCCFFLPNSPPKPFSTAADSSPLGELSVCEGGGIRWWLIRLLILCSVGDRRDCVWPCGRQ